MQQTYEIEGTFIETAAEKIHDSFKNCDMKSKVMNLRNTIGHDIIEAQRLDRNIEKVQINEKMFGLIVFLFKGIISTDMKNNFLFMKYPLEIVGSEKNFFLNFVVEDNVEDDDEDNEESEDSGDSEDDPTNNNTQEIMKIEVKA